MMKQLAESIAAADAVKIASDLVKIPSFSFMENQERDVAVYIYDLFRKEGIETELVEVLPGRYNVTARIPGRCNETPYPAGSENSGQGGPSGSVRGSEGKKSDGNRSGGSLLLTGHLDTVPAYDMEDPFSGRIAGGRLYGRGACDMKGPLASIIAAVIGIHRSGIALQGDLLFAGLIDEEEKGKGVEYLVRHGPLADAVINGEPTNMKAAIGHKGLEWIKIKVIGKKVHGGRMDEGVNAILMASRLIQRIYEEYVPRLKERKHPVLGFPTINVGKIEGGDQPSTVPGSCTLEIDRRWVPEETLEQVYGELKELIAEMQQEDPRFRAEVFGMFSPGELLAHRPFCTDEGDPVVQSIERAFEQAGRPYEGVTVFPAWSDAGVMAAFTSMKCIVMGPGDLALAHSAEESIDTEEIRKAALIYACLACDYCGAEDENKR